MTPVIETITTAPALTEVCRLTYQEYLAQGFIEPQANQELRHYPKLDGIPQTSVHAAYVDGEMVGSHSITLDGPASLPDDRDFPHELQRIRDWCRAHLLTLASAWRFVTRSDIRASRIMVALIRETIRVGCRLGVHVLLTSVHPDKVRTYKKFLGLENVATGVCAAARGAPAVLLLGDSRVITSRCERLGQPCVANCNPPRWPELAGRWTGEIR